MIVNGKEVPVTAKYSHKPYKCNRCGHEESIGTNHWGEIYPPCSNCNWKNPMDGNPSWTCLEDKPSGFGVPKKWRKAALKDIVKIALVVVFIGVWAGTSISRAETIQDAIASHIAATNQLQMGSNYLIVSEYGENGEDLFEVRSNFTRILPPAPNWFLIKVKSPVEQWQPIRPMQFKGVSTFRERRK